LNLTLPAKNCRSNFASLPSERTWLACPATCALAFSPLSHHHYHHRHQHQHRHRHRIAIAIAITITTSTANPSLSSQVRIAKLLLLATTFKCIRPVLDIAACLSHRTPFAAPFDMMEQLNAARASFSVPAGPAAIPAGCKSLLSICSASSIASFHMLVLSPALAEVSDHMLIARVMLEWRAVKAQGRRAEMPWCR
jgi:hypothetical protein